MSSVAPAAINREWIQSEFVKGIGAEEELSAEAKTRSDSPPDPSLSVLYNEISLADSKHRDIVEAIATRYGHTPTHSGGGIGEAFTRLKDKVARIGASPVELLGHDLTSKANAIHWYTAWIFAFKELGDPSSAAELEAILKEETSHRDALQLALNRLVVGGARGPDTAA